MVELLTDAVFACAPYARGMDPFTSSMYRRAVYKHAGL